MSLNLQLSTCNLQPCQARFSYTGGYVRSGPTGQRRPPETPEGWPVYRNPPIKIMFFIFHRRGVALRARFKIVRWTHHATHRNLCPAAPVKNKMEINLVLAIYKQVTPLGLQNHVQKNLFVSIFWLTHVPLSNPYEIPHSKFDGSTVRRFCPPFPHSLTHPLTTFASSIPYPLLISVHSRSFAVEIFPLHPHPPLLHRVLNLQPATFNHASAGQTQLTPRCPRYVDKNRHKRHVSAMRRPPQNHFAVHLTTSGQTYC